MPPIIQVENLGKKYTIRHERGGPRYRRLSEDLVEMVKRPFRSLLPARRSFLAAHFSRLPASPSPLAHPCPPPSEDFWALRDVSFDVQQGEVLGIIGRNGAGKSTLLKILSRITEPTAGRVRIRGRVASLLEVGTGFHPELTGRENIFLNGAVLGMSRAEIRKKFDEIVAFAEVEQFLDTPVKHYSSGMYVRLAFAVAAHLDPEILIVDEVLAVGDAEFQKKCLGKMQDVATQDGRTVLFVSHNMGAVAQLCSRGLLMVDGRVSASAPAADIIRLYGRAVQSSAGTDIEKNFRGPLADKLRFTSLTIMSRDRTTESPFSPGAQIRIDVIGKSSVKIPGFRTTLAIYCEGVRLFSLHDVPEAETVKAGTPFRSSFVLPRYFLRPNDYFVALGGHSASSGDWLWATDLAHFAILEEWGIRFRSFDLGLINVEQCGERMCLSSESHPATGRVW